MSTKTAKLHEADIFSFQIVEVCLFIHYQEDNTTRRENQGGRIIIAVYV